MNRGVARGIFPLQWFYLSYWISSWVYIITMKWYILSMSCLFQIGCVVFFLNTFSISLSSLRLMMRGVKIKLPTFEYPFLTRKAGEERDHSCCQDMLQRQSSPYSACNLCLTISPNLRGSCLSLYWEVEVSPPPPSFFTVFWYLPCCPHFYMGCCKLFKQWHHILMIFLFPPRP